MSSLIIIYIQHLYNYVCESFFSAKNETHIIWLGNLKSVHNFNFDLNTLTVNYKKNPQKPENWFTTIFNAYSQSYTLIRCTTICLRKQTASIVGYDKWPLFPSWLSSATDDGPKRLPTFFTGVCASRHCIEDKNYRVVTNNYM